MSKGCSRGSLDKQWDGGLDKTLSWTRAVAMVLGKKWTNSRYHLEAKSIQLTGGYVWKVKRKRRIRMIACILV